MHDTIIIGGGLAGMYAAKMIGGFVLEREPMLGGRVRHQMWKGQLISLGGGIFRTCDRIIQSLLQDYQIPYEFKQDTIYYTTTRMDVVNTLSWLRNQWKNLKHQSPSVSTMSFKEFALWQLGPQRYNWFIHCTIFNDYENESVEAIVDDPSEFRYQEGGLYGYASLHDLIDALSSEITYQTNTTVTKITRHKKYCEIEAIHRGVPIVYKCKRVIMATCSTTAQSLFSHPLLQMIRSSSCIKIYGSFRTQDIPLLSTMIKGHTLVRFPIHQIIPINPDKGIYLIAYCDESYAEELRPVVDDEANRSRLSRMIEQSFGINPHTIELESIYPHYWREAVHYIDKSIPLSAREKMLHKIRHLYPRVRFVGEMVSEDNGWMEAALESVENIDWCEE